MTLVSSSGFINAEICLMPCCADVTAITSAYCALNGDNTFTGY